MGLCASDFHFKGLARGDGEGFMDEGRATSANHADDPASDTMVAGAWT